MPYNVRASDSGEWEVYNPDTDKVYGSHPTRRAALAQMRALYVNAPPEEEKETPAPVVNASVTPTAGYAHGPGGLFSMLRGVLFPQSKEAQTAIDTTPPQDVQAAAKRGLELRKKYGRGGLSTQEAGRQGIGSGVARANSLARGQRQSPQTVRRMHAFFSRHAKNKTGGESDRGYIAWQLWGGDAGQRWARSLVERMDAAQKEKRSAGDFLVIGDPEKVSTWSLPVKRNGKPDHRLMGAAWAALHGGYRGNRYEGPGREEAIAKLRKLYQAEGMDVPGTKEAGGIAVYKQADGRYRWVSFSSNAYRDRDGEIVSTQALAEDCDRLDATKEYGPLRWWHVDGLDIGECDFNAMSGRILVESGTFKEAWIAEAIQKAAPELQVSIGFTHPAHEPVNGVYKEIRRFERSILPKGRAANARTSFYVKGAKEMATIKEKFDELMAMLGGEDRAKELVSMAEAIQKEADDSGAAFKEADEPAAEPVAEEKAKKPAVPEPEEEDDEEEGDFVGDMTKEAFSEMIGDIVQKAVGPIMAEHKAMHAKATKSENALTELQRRYDDLATKLKEAGEAIKELKGETPAAAANPGYRATQDAATVVKSAGERPQLSAEQTIAQMFGFGQQQ